MVVQKFSMQKKDKRIYIEKIEILFSFGFRIQITNIL